MCFLCNFCRFVIANFCIESGNQHERIIYVLFNIGFNGLKPYSTFIIKADASITNQSCAMQKVINDHWLEYIEFKMPTGAANVYSYIITPVSYTHLTLPTSDLV